MTLSLNDEQRAQLQEGRRRSRGEVAPAVSGNTSQKPPQGPSKARKPQGKGKPAPVGHEALLDKLKAVTGQVRIRLLDDHAPLVGRVMHADKFTVSIKVESYDGDDYKPGEVAVIFKHAMASFVQMEVGNV